MRTTNLIFREAPILYWLILSICEQDRAHRPNANRHLHGYTICCSQVWCVRFCFGKNMSKENKSINKLRVEIKDQAPRFIKNFANEIILELKEAITTYPHAEVSAILEAVQLGSDKSIIELAKKSHEINILPKVGPSKKQSALDLDNNLFKQIDNLNTCLYNFKTAIRTEDQLNLLRKSNGRYMAVDGATLTEETERHWNEEAKKGMHGKLERVNIDSKVKSERDNNFTNNKPVDKFTLLILIIGGIIFCLVLIDFYN